MEKGIIICRVILFFFLSSFTEDETLQCRSDSGNGSFSRLSLIANGMRAARKEKNILEKDAEEEAEEGEEETREDVAT